MSELTNGVEVVLTKDAMSIGVDCTRAQILCKLRDYRSPDFDMQMNGRIMRMPEQKHYSIEELNCAYVFHNSRTLSVSQEIEKDVFFI